MARRINKTGRPINIPLAGNSYNGLMSAADKKALDALSSAPQTPAAIVSNVSLSNSSPETLYIGSPGAVGTSTLAARADHRHPVVHGDLDGGTYHALATTSIAGFMSAQDKVRLDTLWNSPSGGGGGAMFTATFVWNESPAGATDGVNATFTLDYSPNPPESLTLFRNGLLLRPGSPYDFLLSGNIVTFNSPSIPIDPDILRANYLIPGVSPSPIITDHGLLSGLTDDDHLQYLTSPRANTWLATKTTTNLSEGTNLYFTNERAQDAVGNILTASSTISWTYNDGGNTISAAVIAGGVSHASLAGLTTGDPHTQYQLRSEKNASSGYAGLTSGGLLSPSRIPAMPLSFLSDVSPGTPLNGYVLTYNASSGQWQSQSPAGGGGVTDHGALTGLGDNDHTQYQLISEKNTANGYLGLDASGRASPSRLGSGTTGSTVWLRGDGVWSSVPYSPADAITIDAVSIKNPNFESTPGTTPLNSVLVSWGVDNGVSPVDVYGYVTYSGLNTWLSTKTTTNLTEGTQLYYTDERAQDAFGAMVSPSATIKWSYNDAAGKIQASVSPAGISHSSLASLTSGDPHTQYQLRSEKNVANGYAGLAASGLLSPSRIPAMPLSFLSDVSPGTPTDGQILAYHASSGQWRNQSPAAGVVDHGLLSGLGDDDHVLYAPVDGSRQFSHGALRTLDVLEANYLALINAGSLSVDTSLGIDVDAGSVSPPFAQLLFRGTGGISSTTLRGIGDHTGVNTGDVTLAGSPDYITIVGQTITRNKIDLATDVINDLPLSNLVQAASPSILLGRGSASSGDFQQISLGTGLTMTGTTLSAAAGSSSLSGLTDVSPSSPTNNQFLAYHAASGQWRNQSPIAVEDIISCYIDASPDLIAVGKKAYKVMPYNCTVTGWYVVASSSGTITWDIKKSTFASYPTTTTIITGSSPKLVTQSKNSNISITGWSPLSAGDVIDFHISSNTDITNSGLFLKVRRTS